MTFDFAKTVSLLKGGLMDHEATWKSYLEKNPGWQQTATELTGPLLLVSVVLGTIFSRMMGGFPYYGYYGNLFTALLGGLVMAILGFIIAVFVFNFMAGVFKGNSNFPRAFAAVSLAAIPAWIASALAPLIPWIGFLLAFAGGIISLVFLYRIMPMALGVPDEKRTVHFFVSLLLIFVLNIVVGSFMGVSAMNDSLRRGTFSSDGTASRSATPSGVFSQIERQGQLMEAAGADVYDAPSDGELTEAQVKEYVKVVKKSQVMQQEFIKKMEKYDEEMKAKKEAGKNPSIADLSRIYAGVGTAMTVNNAEMEVVKTGNGNWAEHLWVKEQLRVAHIHQGDGSDAVAHNYKLYLEYADELETVMY